MIRILKHPQKEVEIRGVKIPVCLTPNGFTSDLLGRDSHIVNDKEFQFEIIDKIRRLLTCLPIFTTTKLNDKYTSYKLKHIFEYMLGTYVNNGSLIFAMIAEGFDYSNDHINAFFNVNPKIWDFLSNLTAVKGANNFIKKVMDNETLFANDLFVFSELIESLPKSQKQYLDFMLHKLTENN